MPQPRPSCAASDDASGQPTPAPRRTVGEALATSLSSRQRGLRQTLSALARDLGEAARGKLGGVGVGGGGGGRSRRRRCDALALLRPARVVQPVALGLGKAGAFAGAERGPGRRIAVAEDLLCLARLALGLAFGRKRMGGRGKQQRRQRSQRAVANRKC